MIKLETPTAIEPETEHPWAHTIKDVYSNNIKYAHNSITNPIYPKKKEKNPSHMKRIKFTIIGDRVTKEFIYCVNLVNGLHKYRKKSFDAPVIRGVTTVDWPLVCYDLKIKYGGLAFCLTSSVAVLVNDNFLGGDKELKELIETKLNYYLSLDYCKESVAEFANFIKSSGRPCAYMSIAINDEHIGNFIFMLYADIVPNTCENFLRLCKETKGGYSGTPIHRIVKDSWIQCGGFGLKSTDLNCENFMVPHDRRGVLCMANAERHIDCSTQFFVLLQPAPWMKNKFVAFGQLIEGKQTLDKIEAVPTWYESPTSEIIIYKAGIFNMDCDGFIISKGTNQYIDEHIEDLNALGDWIEEVIINHFYTNLQLRELERQRLEMGEGGEYESEEESAAGLRATKRFNRRKEDIEKQLEKSSIGQHTSGSVRRPTSTSGADNNDFDVESYEMEDEELNTKDYQHQSLLSVRSVIERPPRPYYIPLTDVPYPGEKDSNFDLKRFLQGDYCLESDLLKKDTQKKKISTPRNKMLSYENMSDDNSSEKLSLDSDEEKEIQIYLKNNVDRVSFAGSVIRTIAKGATKLNIFEDLQKSGLFTDDELRRWRLASADVKYLDQGNKKVSVSLPSEQKEHHGKIKRRQTGFVHPDDLEKIRLFPTTMTDNGNDDDSDSGGDGSRKVRITVSAINKPEHPTLRRPTAYVRNLEDGDDFAHEIRQSVLERLFDDVKHDDDLPTLKDYKPLSELRSKDTNLTFSKNYRITSDESTKEKYFRKSITVGDTSYEHVLNLQHGKKATRKMSTDYVNTIDRIEHKAENSIRSVEFAKTRPAISVTDYQLKNKQYQMELKEAEKNTRGIRLPGDSPLYSDTLIPIGTELTDKKSHRSALDG